MRQELLDTLNREIKNLYHNASPEYPYDLMDQYERVTGSCPYALFNDWASFEISYLNEGGAYGHTPYGRMSHNKDLHSYAKHMKNKKYYRDVNSAPEYLISNYGDLYTWGRGGRTLAPIDLINQHGNSSFSVKQFEHEDINASSATELLIILRAFNKYVKRWNSRENLLYLYQDAISSALSEVKHEQSALRDQALRLIKDIKQSQPLSDTIFTVLREKLQDILKDYRHNKERLRYV